MCGCIMADVREGEACFQKRSSSIIKMWDLFETGSSLLSALCIFLGFESYLEQTFLGLFRCALRKNFQIDNCLQAVPIPQGFPIQSFYRVLSQACCREISYTGNCLCYLSPPYLCVLFN